MRPVDDAKELARIAWSASPTGSTSAGDARPGTREFFERALKFRSEVEQPWLPEVVPFHTMANRRVLEIGFGPGFDTLAFVRSGAIYTGIDLVPENAIRTKQHLAFYGFNPDVREGDAEALDFPDECFDVVYSNGVLHHTPDIERAFSEAARVLKPGGEFYVIVYHKNSIVARLSTVVKAPLMGLSIRNRFARMESNSAGVSPLVKVYSRQEVAEMLSRAGFRVKDICVRKLLPDDMPLAKPLLIYLYRLIPQRIYDRLGLHLGWYVIGCGVK
ncbi:MAG TPA: class I SAM-dependent methyltransferase [Xanthobacteraceae bacterium]|nr:class I SAM-dependent methyltransferase [Xanthobacteraceae bacterium]